MELTQQSGLVLPRQLVFPETQHAPAGAAQCARDEPVARAIAKEFASPPGRAVRRPRGVLRATVPETTVHKDREPQFWENEIRFHA